MLLIFPCQLNAQSIYETNIISGDTKVGDYLPLLKGKRVGLVVNQTSVALGQALPDLLQSRGVNVVAIFVPEHGFRGNADAGANIENSLDSSTGLPVVSLYGKHKKPEPQDLAGIDVMVYDLQDVGARFYTYISTLEYCMEACAQNHKQFIVLDRPDPNGFYIAGPVLQPDCQSFVGRQPIPVVYAMTAGEYARMITGEGWFANAAELDLKVVECSNYTHSMKYKLPVAPSPNLRNMAAIYAYPSLCLFEGTVVSVGRGTDLPFAQFGCPEVGKDFHYSFTPHSGPGAKSPPYEGKICFGELVASDESDYLLKYGKNVNLQWLIKMYNAYPDKDKFFTSFFEKLAGTKKLAERIKAGESETEIVKSWQPEIKKFKKIRKKYLIYKDFE